MGCSHENAPDCIQKAGDIVKRELSVSEFDKITVFENITLVVRQGPQHLVEIETGENLLNEISAEIIEGRLVLRNENNCNYFRQYGITKIYVTSPLLREIRSSTSWPVTTEGVLTYANLSLLSEGFTQREKTTTDGSFNMQLDVDNLYIVVNGFSYYHLEGAAKNFNINVASGDSKIDTDQLAAQNIIIDHRGSNDVRIQPIENLRGLIRGPGNVISVSRPPVIEVEELYKGKLIFED